MRAKSSVRNDKRNKNTLKSLVYDKEIVRGQPSTGLVTSHRQYHIYFIRTFPNKEHDVKAIMVSVNTYAHCKAVSRMSLLPALLTPVGIVVMFSLRGGTLLI